MRELLDGYEAVLGRSPAVARDPGSAPQHDPVSVVAGPFDSTTSLREFERALKRIPGVRDVAVRGYRPGNRAVIEVALD
jgi:hypothetical protein